MRTTTRRSSSRWIKTSNHWPIFPSVANFVSHRKDPHHSTQLTNRPIRKLIFVLFVSNKMRFALRNVKRKEWELLAQMAYTLEFFSLQTETSIKILYSSLEKVLMQIIRFLFTLEKKEKCVVRAEHNTFLLKYNNCIICVDALVTTRAIVLKPRILQSGKGLVKQNYSGSIRIT